MDERTAAALGRLNRAFYERFAEDFSRTRRRPWPGWERLLEAPGAAELAALASRRRRILDAGCGNGRFAAFLEERLGSDLDYLGVDASPALLGIARERAGDARSTRRFLALDLVADAGAGLPAGPFDLVAALGLLHHVPGAGRRRALLAALARRLAPGGCLALAFWQFGDRERFRRRIVPWETYNRTAAEPIDPNRLDEHDVLLAWGDAETDPLAAGRVRYCHWTTPPEAEALARATALETGARFRADGETGDLNLYYLLRRPKR